MFAFFCFSWSNIRVYCSRWYGIFEAVHLYLFLSSCFIQVTVRREGKMFDLIINVQKRVGRCDACVLFDKKKFNSAFMYGDFVFLWRERIKRVLEHCVSWYVEMQSKRILFFLSFAWPVKIKQNSNKKKLCQNEIFANVRRKKKSLVIDNSLWVRVERILTAFSLRKCNKCVMRMMRVWALLSIESNLQSRILK